MDIINKLKRIDLNNIDYRKVYKKIFKVTFIVVIIIVCIRAVERVANASIIEMMGGPDSFNNLSGNGKYLGAPYRYNYYLDVKSLGMTEWFNAGTNFLANFFWELATFITYALLVAFNLAFSMDIANLFSSLMDSIMMALKTNIFDRYVHLAISIALVSVVISLFRRNVDQVLKRVFYMAFAISMSIVIANYSGKIVSTMTQISKEIGASSIVSMNNETETNNQIAIISGNLWGNLVHTPWLELEAKNKLTNDQVESILRLDKESEERQDIVDQINKGNSNILKANSGPGRIVPSLVYALVNGFKMGVMLIIAVFAIVFQIITILLIVALMFYLLLSMIPSFGGVNLIVGLGKQLLGNQVGIVITSMFLGLLIKIDELIATYISSQLNYGWLMITIVQVAIYAGVIWQRKRLFAILEQIQRSVSGNHSVHDPRRYIERNTGGDSGYDYNDDNRNNDRESKPNSSFGNKVANGFGEGIYAVGNGIRNFSERMKQGHNKNQDYNEFYEQGYHDNDGVKQGLFITDSGYGDNKNVADSDISKSGMQLAYAPIGTTGNVSSPGKFNSSRYFLSDGDLNNISNTSDEGYKSEIMPNNFKQLGKLPKPSLNQEIGKLIDSPKFKVKDENKSSIINESLNKDEKEVIKNSDQKWNINESKNEDLIEKSISLERKELGNESANHSNRELILDKEDIENRSINKTKDFEIEKNEGLGIEKNSIRDDINQSQEMNTGEDMGSRYDNIITTEEIEDARNKNFIYELNEDYIKNLNSNVDFNKERDTNSSNIVTEQELIDSKKNLGTKFEIDDRYDTKEKEEGLILKDRGEIRKNIEDTPVILSPDKIENRIVNFNSIENKEVVNSNKKIDILEDNLNIESNNIKETNLDSEDRVSLFSGKIKGKSY